MNVRIAWCLAVSLSWGICAQAHAQQQDSQEGDQLQKVAEYLTIGAATQAQDNQNLQAQDNQNLYSTANFFQRPVQQTLDYTLGSNGVAFFEDLSRTAGMSLAPADEALRTHLKLPKDEGLIVTALDRQSSAAQAGVQQNDVLLRLHDTTLRTPDDLEEGLKAAGDKPAALLILRGGDKLALQVQPQVRATMGPVRPEPPAFWIGVTVSSVEPALRTQLRLPDKQGLLVIDVMKDSPAAKAEVKVHDILLKIIDKPLDSQQTLLELVQSAGEKPVQLELVREGRTQKIDVTPERRKPSQFKVSGRMPRNYQFQFVQPGAVWRRHPVGPDGNAGQNGMKPQTFEFTPLTPTQWPQPHDAVASNKRLDEIEAQIKQLNKAIEELSKSLKDRK
jgi:membrane-associated protease RseP (regulator of RpoE activity)